MSKLILFNCLNFSLDHRNLTTTKKKRQKIQFISPYFSYISNTLFYLEYFQIYRMLQRQQREISCTPYVLFLLLFTSYITLLKYQTDLLTCQTQSLVLEIQFKELTLMLPQFRAQIILLRIAGVSFLLSCPGNF